MRMSSILQRVNWTYAREYIHRKEEERQYPLNLVNDMSLLIRISPIVSKLVAHVIRKNPMTLRDECAFSTSRLFRLYMVMLIDIALQSECGQPSVTPARYVTSLLEARLRLFPHCGIMRPTGSRHAIDLRSGQSLLAVSRELADRLGMGDHTMFAHSPAPINGHRRACWYECLFHQPHCPTDLPKLTFVRSLDAGLLPTVDLFRGKFHTPVPMQRAGSMSVWAGAKELTHDEVRLTYELISSMLRREVAKAQAYEFRTDLVERAKSNNYTLDLVYHLKTSGTYWRREIQNALGVVSNLSTPIATYFCNLVEQGDDIVRRMTG